MRSRPNSAVPVAALAERTFVAIGERDERDPLAAMFASAGFLPDERYELSGVEPALTLVAAGLAVAVVPRAAVPSTAPVAVIELEDAPRASCSRSATARGPTPRSTSSRCCSNWPPRRTGRSCLGHDDRPVPAGRLRTTSRGRAGGCGRRRGRSSCSSLSLGYATYLSGEGAGFEGEDLGRHVLEELELVGQQAQAEVSPAQEPLRGRQLVAGDISRVASPTSV